MESSVLTSTDTADKVMGFDVDIIPYAKEAYKHKKYAFVSDYARFWIMYQYGGLYFDTDVEVIRPMYDIIAKGNFMGFEMNPDGKNTPGVFAPRYCFAVNPGLGFCMEKAHPFIWNMIGIYNNLAFQLPPEDVSWYKTIVAYTTEWLFIRGLKNKKGVQKIDDITVYPSEYFAPINVISGKLHLTENTRTIHRYMGSWNGGNIALKEKIKMYLPEWIFLLNNRIKRRKYKIR